MAKVIMIQGTMSNAGKSFLTAGLCRIFRQDGFKVAPFKSQNMALNSYITKDGLEIGRAQAMQAEACGIEPETDMNPILLKPTSHMGSQLIVNGEVRGNYPASEYFKMKKSLIPDIRKAYDSLASRSDIIVVEGAGSPAEINLRENDIVNMGLAELLDAPVLLSGDIDRGGVFAQLYGTVALLQPEEQKRIRGLIINKFRGDKEILKPGLSMLYDRLPIPVAGVIPYMDVDIDDEDSLSDRLGKRASQEGKGKDHEGQEASFKISVIRLPRISNFTDFNILERQKGVSLSYVVTPEELHDSDLIIIPGTKNTMGDLLWMKEKGLADAVKAYALQGTEIMGICGGYQILGEKILDPGHAEEGGEAEGLSLLPIRTIFAEEKRRTRVHGIMVHGERLVSGYEIHMGTTTRTGGEPLFRIREEGQTDWKEDGCIRENIRGTYLHGIFDSGYLKEILPDAELTGDGGGIMVTPYQEQQYDKMARILRENLDMDLVYRILNKTDVEDRSWTGQKN